MRWPTRPPSVHRLRARLLAVLPFSTRGRGRPRNSGRRTLALADAGRSRCGAVNTLVGVGQLFIKCSSRWSAATWRARRAQDRGIGGRHSRSTRFQTKGRSRYALPRRFRRRFAPPWPAPRGAGCHVGGSRRLAGGGGFPCPSGGDRAVGITDGDEGSPGVVVAAADATRARGPDGGFLEPAWAEGPDAGPGRDGPAGGQAGGEPGRAGRPERDLG